MNKVMKTTIFLLLLCLTGLAQAQAGHELTIPRGVVYNYGRESLNDSAKALITAELKGQPTYSLIGRILIVGPELWTRFSKVKQLKAIEGGNVSNRVDGKILPGKMTQRIEDSRLFWDALRDEIGKQDFTLRYANPRELAYYWSIISFDIEEPLFIIETAKHNYILNLSPKDLQLFYLEEAPR